MDRGIVTRIFQAKARSRKALVRLPFEEKIKILIRLQRIARDIRKGECYSVWPEQ